MAFLKSIISKLKSEKTDGQEEYFRDDFPPVVNQPSKKKPESKADGVADKPIVEKKPAATKKSTSKPAVKDEKPAAKSTSKVKQPIEDKTGGNTKPAAKSSAKTATKSGTKTASKVTKSKELTNDSPEVKGAVAIKEGRDTANGKWDIRRAKDGRFFFSLYASNHTVIAYSQIYSSTTAVTTGINSVITNAPKCEIEDTTLKKPVSLPCPKWEIYLDKAGEYRFRLYAPNGLVICHAAHGYASKSGCKGGIESIRRFCVEAKVDKSYLK